jgi:hypothetical protein
MAPNKTRVNMFVDSDVVDYFRKESEKYGTGYQTMMNTALRAAAGMNQLATSAADLLPTDHLRHVVEQQQKALTGLGTTLSEFANGQADIATRMLNQMGAPDAMAAACGTSELARAAEETSRIARSALEASGFDKTALHAAQAHATTVASMQSALGTSAKDLLEQSNWARKAIDDAMRPLKDIKF